MELTEFTSRIFEYDNYRQFIKDYFELKKKEDKKYSLRFFAQRAGFKSHSTCLHIITGRRNLTLESVQKLMKVIPLKKKQKEYFTSLVQFNQAADYNEKLEHFNNLQKLKKATGFYRINNKQFEYFANWHLPVIRELVIYSDWKGNYKRLGKMLQPPLTARAAEEAVNTLLKIGLLKRNAGNKFSQSDLVVSADDVPAHVFKNLKTNFILKGIDAMETLPNDKLHLSCATIAFSYEKYKKICEMIDEFREKVLAEAIEEESVDNIYSLNFLFFPLTKDIKD